MKKLMVWGYSAQSLDELAKRKVPKVSLGEVGISEEFNPKKTHPDFDFPWSWFVKGQEIPPMPEQVYVCLKKVFFDLSKPKFQNIDLKKIKIRSKIKIPKIEKNI